MEITTSFTMSGAAFRNPSTSYPLASFSGALNGVKDEALTDDSVFLTMRRRAKEPLPAKPPFMVNGEEVGAVGKFAWSDDRLMCEVVMLPNQEVPDAVKDAVRLEIDLMLDARVDALDTRPTPPTVDEDGVGTEYPGREVTRWSLLSVSLPAPEPPANDEEPPTESKPKRGHKSDA